MSRISVKLFPLTFILFAAATPAQTLSVGTVSGLPGESIWFDVKLFTAGKPVFAVQNDIGTNPNSVPLGSETGTTPLGAAAQLPVCELNSDLAGVYGKTLYRSFLPQCTATACARAIVMSAQDGRSIPDNTVLYRCRVDISAATAPGNYKINLTRLVASDPIGNKIPLPKSVGGTIVVSQSPTCP